MLTFWQGESDDKRWEKDELVRGDERCGRGAGQSETAAPSSPSSCTTMPPHRRSGLQALENEGRE